MDKDRQARVPAYKEMILQISTDYSGLPDVRTLSINEIQFFYEGIREGLKKSTKPRG